MLGRSGEYSVYESRKTWQVILNIFVFTLYIEQILWSFFFVWMRRLAAGMGVGVRSMPTGSFGCGVLMLQDPKPLMNPKETSLMTHPDASMKMYDIDQKVTQGYFLCKLLMV